MSRQASIDGIVGVAPNPWAGGGSSAACGPAPRHVQEAFQ